MAIIRRDLVTGIGALFGAVVFGARESAARGRRHRGKSGNRKKTRNILKRQCQQLCSGVRQNCLWRCGALGYADDYCNPYCAVARDSCHLGCGY